MQHLCIIYACISVRLPIKQEQTPIAHGPHPNDSTGAKWGARKHG